MGQKVYKSAGVKRWKNGEKVYEEQLRAEVNAERKSLEKGPIEEKARTPPHSGTITKTVSAVD